MEYQPARIQTESVITKAAEELRRFIEARDLGPGEALPPETQLSTMLGISRNSVFRDFDVFASFALATALDADQAPR